MEDTSRFFKKDKKTKDVLKFLKDNKDAQQRIYTFLRQGMCVQCRNKMVMLLRRGVKMEYKQYCNKCQINYDRIMKNV